MSRSDRLTRREWQALNYEGLRSAYEEQRHELELAEEVIEEMKTELAAYRDTNRQAA